MAFGRSACWAPVFFWAIGGAVSRGCSLCTKGSQEKLIFSGD